MITRPRRHAERGPAEDTPAELLKRAGALLQRQNACEAMECVDKCIAREPGNSSAWLEKGKVLFAIRTGYSEVMEAINESIRLDPENKDALRSKVMIASACCDHKTALETLNVLLRKVDKTPQGAAERAALLRNVSMQHAAMFHYDDAIREFRRVFSAAAGRVQRAEEFLWMGELHSHRALRDSKLCVSDKRDLTAAMKCYKSAISEAWKHVMGITQADRGDLLADIIAFTAKRGDVKQMQAVAAKAAVLKSEAHYARGEYADAYETSERLLRAVEANAMFAPLDRVRLFDRCGLSLCALGRYEDALGRFDAAIGILRQEKTFKAQQVLEVISGHKAIAQFNSGKGAEKIPGYS